VKLFCRTSVLFLSSRTSAGSTAPWGEDGAEEIKKMELDNQNPYIIIAISRVGCMSLDRHFPNGSFRTICIRAALASIALLAVLAARNVPPHFRSVSSVHSAACADSQHDQRPRFDNSGSKWSAPVDSFRPVPPAAESADLAPASRLFSTLQTKGFHFNRPPPIS
jgi:hypothetical protein